MLLLLQLPPPPAVPMPSGSVTSSTGGVAARLML
jgi:hypothetical protein